MASIDTLAEQVKMLAENLEDRSEEAISASRNKKQHYRSVFTETEYGSEVLRDILRDLRFMQVPTSDHQVTLQAYATVLLRKLGVLEKDGGSRGAINNLLRHNNL